jgi:hypothetical protein
MNQKKRVVVSYENLDNEVKMAVLRKYPGGWTNHVFKVTLPNNNFFHAITVDTEHASYLIKVKVKLDRADKLEEELFKSDYEKDSGGDDDDSASDTHDEADTPDKTE